MAIIWLRNFCYDRGIFRISRVSVPVISVGNIVLGGSGKTPIAIAIAKEFSGVAIVTRGYKSASEHGPPRLVDAQDWKKFGDEPCLMAKRVPEAMVIVGKDRVAGARFAIEQGAKMIILDDGMQHRRLHRDLNIVVINDRLQEERMFPRGRLREPLSSLKRADVQLVYGKDFHYTTNVDLEGKRVAIFCGIAKPERFRRFVEEGGAQVVCEKFLSDHIPMRNLPAFLERARDLGAEEVLCTEKDAIKLYDLTGVTVVPIEAKLQEKNFLCRF